MCIKQTLTHSAGGCDDVTSQSVSQSVSPPSTSPPFVCSFVRSFNPCNRRPPTHPPTRCMAMPISVHSLTHTHPLTHSLTPSRTWSWALCLRRPAPTSGRANTRDTRRGKADRQAAIALSGAYNRTQPAQRTHARVCALMKEGRRNVKTTFECHCMVSLST